MTNQFVKPAAVILRIQRQGIFTSPDNLPTLPRIGDTVSIEVPGHGFKYVAKVEEVNFSTVIQGGGNCYTRFVEVNCELLHLERIES